MTRYEIEQGLDALYRDLNNIQDMDEETARRVYNVDCKADIIEVIEEEIDTYETILSGPDTGEENDMDYDVLCLIQGLSRYA